MTTTDVIVGMIPVVAATGILVGTAKGTGLLKSSKRKIGKVGKYKF
jgi:hypothetical protein